LVHRRRAGSGVAAAGASTGLQRRLTPASDIDLRWELQTDPAKASEIEVTFAEEGPDRTRVVLRHRHLERHGEG
jgi:hypothetical protein